MSLLRRGAAVWVEDKDHAWVEGEVVGGGDSREVVVLTSRGTKVSRVAEKVLPRDPAADHGGVDDMTKLTYLNEPGVLYNLARRYSLNEIYTYTGSILIAVNPFTNLPHLYNTHMMEQYKGAQFGDLSPHVFAVADVSYRSMMTEARSQSILVSGESGAGKTETTKLIMQYLTHVGGRASSVERSVEQQVLESNPLLEAFGNARTIRNDNSSRFGKFVEIQFDGHGRISGAAIRTYLLERSRVVKITDPERNYHCFYQLCASEKDAEKYKLGHPSTFHYLNQSKTYELNGMSSSVEYLKTRRAMDIVGISVVDQEAIFRTLAAILHLGNIEFSPGEEHDSSVVKNERSKFHLNVAAALFMCDSSSLLATLCSRTIHTHEGCITKKLDCSAAVANRDALAKTVYSRLFDWLVENINKSIGQDVNSKMQIGLLDIYGFECFQHNSFEQFCINFANEKLQQHFNEHVFKMEQEEYGREEINWSYIDFIDNQDVLDLIEKKPIGVISLLDEACMFPKSTHQTFATKLFQSLLPHPRLEREKFSETDFSVSHYAGKVTYHTDSFIEKNRDYVSVEHCNLLSSSSCCFIAGLFPSFPEETPRSSYKFSSVASRFKQQLQALMETLNLTDPHYIRCIKPNSLNSSQNFENHSVLHQLRCGGVLQAVRISLAGYPTRRLYSEFVSRFGILVPGLMDGSFDEKKMAEEILKKLKLESFQLGRTKVFLRAGQIAVLDSHRAETLDMCARLIQGSFWAFITRKKFVQTKSSAIVLQAFCRGCLARGIYADRKQRAAVILIQKNVRGWLCRRSFSKLMSSVLVIQSSVRGFLDYRKAMCARVQRAAVLIQVFWTPYTDEIRAHLPANSLEGEQIWRAEVPLIYFHIVEYYYPDRFKRQFGGLQDIPKRCSTFPELHAIDLRGKVHVDWRAKHSLYIARWEEREVRTIRIDQSRGVFATPAYEQWYGTITRRFIGRLGATLASNAQWRAWKVFSSFQRLKHAAVVVQCKLRQKLAKQVLCKLRMEAQEVGSLRVQKNWLEKSLEDANLRLQLEKFLRASFEESKMLEIAKLHKTIEVLGAELDSAKKTIASEHTKNKSALSQLDKSEKTKAILEEQLLQMDDLLEENLYLKQSIETLEKTNSEMDQELLVVQKNYTDTSHKLESMERKYIQIQQDMNSLEAKISILEDENRVLRQKSLSIAPFNNISTLTRQFVEKNSIVSSVSRTDQKLIFETPTPTKLGSRPCSLSGSQRAKIAIGIHEDRYQLLSRCINEGLGFKDGKPVAACVIYKLLLHWNAFGAEKTTIFDFIIEGINDAIKTGSDVDVLPYWLSNTSALLCLLQRNLRSNGFLKTPCRRSYASSGPLGRMTHIIGFGSEDSVSCVEARYPAILFKQQLTACLEKIFGLIRDNMKKEISPLLTVCIQAPKSSRAPTTKSAKAPGGHLQLSKHWDSIIQFLDILTERLRQNYVPSFFIRKLVTQVFSFINIQLFNSLLLRRECCAFSNGEYVKSGLAELEKWISNVTEEFAGTSWHELNYIRQAVGFLVLHHKRKKTLEEICQDLCPALTVRQIYRICTMYCDDKYNTQSVSDEVIAKMREMVAKESNLPSNSFLLDDDMSIPFSTEDISKAIPIVDPADIELPSTLCEYTSMQGISRRRELFPVS